MAAFRFQMAFIIANSNFDYAKRLFFVFVASQCQLGAQYGAREGLKRCKLGSNIDSKWGRKSWAQNASPAILKPCLAIVDLLLWLFNFSWLLACFKMALKSNSERFAYTKRLCSTCCYFTMSPNTSPEKASREASWASKWGPRRRGPLAQLVLCLLKQKKNLVMISFSN